MQTRYNSTQKQEGMTFIGIVLMFLFVGFLLLAVLRVWPMYYENLDVQKSLEGLVTEYENDKTLTVAKMKKSLQARLDVQNVSSIKGEDVKFKKTRKGYTVDASYQSVENFLGNLNFMVDFEHVIELEK